MDRRFMTILAVLAIIFVGIFALSQRSSDKSSNGSSTAQPTNHIEGQGKSGVTLLEYGDYECSACEAYEPVLKQVRITYAKEIRFQFRNLPLSAVHLNAFASARAAEAASLQNEFWGMHDALYNPSNWQSWTTSSNAIALFKTYAQRLGLDTDKFQSDFASEKLNSTIQADLEAFKKTGQRTATPTFFLNGVYLDSARLTDENNRPSFEKFKAILDAEIAAKAKQ